jgi:hypothetical protein
MARPAFEQSENSSSALPLFKLRLNDMLQQSILP